ncbi:MAG: ABC transporter ATP-binding protein [Zoogloeaceae bacterium]|jgi:iron complex transport system ATP-binding protein|nr:ABC transporter ATP-binding protein [Zoogloeaceae bacterium]
MVEVSNLEFAAGGKTLCSRLSFSLSRGNIMAVLGPNGRGKTTLLRTLLGAHRASAGRVCFAAHAACVPQHSATIFSYDVLTMVTLGRSRHLRWYQSPGEHDIDVARSCLEIFQLAHLAKQPFNALSGGEKQLVTIAQAIASDSPILILDEPASALDLSNQNIVLSALRRLARERNITIIFTTHHPQHAQHIADYTLLLFPQAENAFDRTQNVCTDAHLTRLYGLPVRVASLPQDNRRIDYAIPVFS